MTKSGKKVSPGTAQAAGTSNAKAMADIPNTIYLKLDSAANDARKVKVPLRKSDGRYTYWTIFNTSKGVVI